MGLLDLLAFTASIPETPDTEQIKNAGTTAIGVLIATAILIIGWRLLNNTAKFMIAVLGLGWFILVFVVPNYGTGTP